MDAFITKPITPEKLHDVLARYGGEALPEGPAGAPFPVPEVRGVKLDLIIHLTDGSPASLARELAKYADSLDEAVRGVSEAHRSGSRAAAASSAHRVLSLARMVGAEDLAGAAADIQDYAPVYTDRELADEVARVQRHAAELRGALARIGEGAALNPSWAS